MPFHPVKKPKRGRTSRGTFISIPASPWRRWWNALTAHGALLRITLALVAIVLLLFGVEAWKAPFRFRLGDNPPHGVITRVDFTRVNEEETRKARIQREAQVPFVFQHNPETLAGLTADLEKQLREVAAADNVQSLSSETQTAFGFRWRDAFRGDAVRAADVEASFQKLKNAVRTDFEGPVSRLDQILQEFETFIRPLDRFGVVDPEDLSRNRIRLEDKILVFSGESGLETVVSPADVQLSEMLKDAGLLGKAWSTSPNLNQIRALIEHWLIERVPPTLEYDEALTLVRRHEAVRHLEPITDTYPAGQILALPGQLVDESLLAVLRSEYEEVERQASYRQRVVRVVAVFLMLLVLAVMIGFFLVRSEQRLVRSVSRMSVFLLSMLVTVILGRYLSVDPWRAELLPLAVTVMVFAVAYNQVLATLVGFSLSLLLTLSTLSDLGHFVVMVCVTGAASMQLTQVSSRLALIKVGFWTGIVCLVVTCGVAIIRNQSLTTVWADSSVLVDALRGAALCLIAGYFVAGSLPFVESMFGVVTDISLLEISDVSHPLLQELVRRAPGTYNHSISVATIGESAADSIGANGLLVRVGAYFHDIGKMLKPQYFVENMTEGMHSRHEHLAPAMSTLIIIGHVKDGVDLARQYDLPQPLIDFIEQHHGTTLVEYFYNEASRLADQQPDHRADVEESSFRYPGPKPQTREAGVMMLADAVESASRTLSDPTAKRIENLVHKLTLKRLLDGQFDESTLTLSEIRTVEESLTKSLIGIYHGRIKYPEQRSA